MSRTYQRSTARSGATKSPLCACLLALGFLFVLNASVAAARQPAGWTPRYVRASRVMADLHLMATADSSGEPAHCCLKNTCINPAVAGPAILNGRDLTPRDYRSSPAGTYPALPARSRVTGLRARVPDRPREGPAGPPVYFATARFRL